MKRIGRTLCLLLVLLALAALALAWWQRDNLKALYRARTEDAETILRESQAQLEARQRELEQYNVILKTPTREEKDELLSGGNAEAKTADAPKETDKAREPAPEEVPAQPPAEEIPAEPPAERPGAQSVLDRCVQELYDCEISLMARLGTMKQEAVREWNALPKSRRTKAKKLEIGQRGLEACYDLEVEIDAQVQGILARYRAELESIDADTAPLNTLWEYYCEEKASTKAYYLNKYL